MSMAKIITKQDEIISRLLNRVEKLEKKVDILKELLIKERIK